MLHFCFLELCFCIARLNFTKICLILFFQKPVPFPLNLSRFQEIGSDVFWLTVNSICFTPFRSSYIMTIVFLYILSVFAPGDCRIKTGSPANCKEEKKSLVRPFFLRGYFFSVQLKDCLLLPVSYINADKKNSLPFPWYCLYKRMREASSELL